MNTRPPTIRPTALLIENFRGWLGEPVLPTVSIGIAQLNADESDLQPLIERADEALYEAKNGGRNRTVLSRQDAMLSSSTAA